MGTKKSVYHTYKNNDRQCDVCNKSVSYYGFNKHIKSMKHLKNVDNSKDKAISEMVAKHGRDKIDLILSMI